MAGKGYEGLFWRFTSWRLWCPMKYPAYSKYKDSDVQWLREVPEHWEIKRLKLSAHLTDKKVGADEDNPVPYIGLENIESWTGNLLRVDPNVIPSGVANRFTKKNTLFGKLRPYLAKACNPEFDGLCSTELLVIKSVDFDRRALLYLLLADGFINLVDSSTYGSKMPRANWDFIGNCLMPIPPLPEQTAIADFLDLETGRIDTLVAKKRRLLELLEEKRTALISRTVTRGLPEDVAHEFGLEPHTRFKDSGIDWLGEVPEGWEILKFSREVNIAEGQVNPEMEPFAQMVLIGPEHVEANTGQLLEISTAADQSAISGKYFCKMGDVIYSKIRPALRKLVIAPENCLCSADMYPLRGDSQLNNHFIYWLLLSDQFLGWSVLKSDRVAMPKINRITLKELKIPVPPLPEQTAIATYLDRETAKIDRLKDKIQEAIARLQEYRTALITAAVTGKIDVRNRAV
jgi:type I restriction enzyme S subunit